VSIDIMCASLLHVVMHFSGDRVSLKTYIVEIYAM